MVYIIKYYKTGDIAGEDSLNKIAFVYVSPLLS